MTPESTPARGPVTVTGGAGYVGSLVVRLLLEQGHRVRVLDNFLFGSDPLLELEKNPALEIVRGDIRRRDDLDRVLSGSRGVLHLAGLVGDPACGLDPELTRAVNLESTRTLIEACRAAAVERVVFASTCSVYGAAGEEWLDEDSPTDPVSLYAETNLRSEEILREAFDGSATALTVLRFATIYGVSPRMRFDLVVNLLTARAIRDGRLEVHGGQQWRPQVHVRDVARALVEALDQPPEAAAGVFNVGSDSQNLRIAELAKRIAAQFPGTELEVQDVRDPRSYRVSFRRIVETWEFQTTMSLETGVLEVARFLEETQAEPSDSRFHNVDTLREQLESTGS